jgi:D-3-phosphoglycerate dehydrogenase
LYRIKVLDRIAPEGLALLGNNFAVGSDQEDPQGILVRSSRVDIADYPSLLAVARAGAGVNNITVEKATGAGICVFNTPGANANAVAELVFTMLGIGARNLHEGMDFCRSLAGRPEIEVKSRVESEKKKFRGFELVGKTIGVLGLGKIGLQVANRGVTAGMRVIGFDPFPALENIHQLSPEVLLARSLGEMLSRVDVLTLHLPLNDKTRGVVDSAFLARLHAGAILINFARGEIVAEEAVLAALDSGRLARYLCDFPSSAIIGHPRVLCSPHLGASTEESEEQCALMAVGELKSYLEYGNVSRSVNFPTAEAIPAGNVVDRLVMINRDVPGMIGFASQVLGNGGINIISYLNESNGVIGYNLIDLEAPIPQALLAEISGHPGVIRTRVIDLSSK